MKANIYKQDGQTTGTMDLPENIFGLPWNADLVHQVVTAMQANLRTNRAQARNRGEVSGGGKKPWQQKGTGRARHGSSRSPLWKGGGVTHGPTAERSYFQKINKKMKAKALMHILSQKWRDGEVLLVDKISLPTMKTKVAAETLRSLAGIKGFAELNYQKGHRALLTLPERSAGVTRSFRNLATTAVCLAEELNPLNTLTYRFVVLTEPEKAISILAKRLSNK